jgi:hypothetical protein
MDNQLVTWNSDYLSKILTYQGIGFETGGKLCKISGFDDYNQLIDINALFSKNPAFAPVDRTNCIVNPFNQWIDRAWAVPTVEFTLEQAMESKVIDLCQRYDKINIMWSGGIDSTAMLTAFLKHAPDFKKLRILWSPWSTYEHPEYLEFLKRFPIETIDTSGITYLDTPLDGIFLTGEGGDELMASLDQSFFEVHAPSLHRPWQTWFREQGASDQLIDWTKNNFSIAGRPIETLLHARWWFYTAYKNSSIIREKMQWLFDLPQFSLDRLQGFFNCKEFESWIYWNVEHIIDGTEYRRWKQPLKNYCVAFDGFNDWCDTKTKHGSYQMLSYTYKKIALKNQHWIALLTDGSRLSTANLPFLTKKEWMSLGDQAYLFNHAKHI